MITNIYKIGDIMFYIIYCLSAIISVIYGILLDEKSIILFTILFSMIVITAKYYIKAVEKKEFKNYERLEKIDKNFNIVAEGFMITIALASILDYYFNIMDDENLFGIGEFIVSSIIIILTIFFIYKMCHLPPRN